MMIDISANDNQPLLKASTYGHIDIVKFILSHPRFNRRDCSGALILASECDQPAVVRLLLSETDENPANHDNTAIIHASLRHYGECLVVIKRS